MSGKGGQSALEREPVIPLKKKATQTITKAEWRRRQVQKKAQAKRDAEKAASEFGESVWACVSGVNIFCGLLGAWQAALFVLACYDINKQPQFDLKTWVIVTFCMAAVYFFWAIYSLAKHCTMSREEIEDETNGPMPWSMAWHPLFILTIMILYTYAGSHGARLLADRDHLQATDSVGYLVDINLILFAIAAASGLYVLMMISSFFSEMMIWKHFATQRDDDLVVMEVDVDA
jgi:hypothetical protein